MAPNWFARTASGSRLYSLLVISMKKFWAGTDGHAATAVVVVCVAELMLVLVSSTVVTLVCTVVVREVEVILSVARYPRMSFGKIGCREERRDTREPEVQSST